MSLEDVAAERGRQDALWGEQHHPDGTDAVGFTYLADWHRTATQTAADNGFLTWKHILLEEVYEAMAEEDKAALRTELVQVAAVCVAWVEDLDSQTAAVGGDA